MDEAQAKQWLQSELSVSRETVAKLDRYVALLLEETQRQNLIARSTAQYVWDRHIVDSAQLLPLAGKPEQGSNWLDLGSGAGLPGIVLALIADIRITLVESRTRRAEFLNFCVDEFGLDSSVSVEDRRLEKLKTQPFSAITARAFAPLPKLFDLAYRFAHRETVWILPKGKSVEGDLADAKPAWQGDFGTVQSATDENSFIIVARNVKPRKRP